MVLKNDCGEKGQELYLVPERKPVFSFRSRKTNMTPQKVRAEIPVRGAGVERASDGEL